MICWHGLQRRIGKPTRSTNGGATRLHTLTPQHTTSSANATTVITAVPTSIDQCSLANPLVFLTERGSVYDRCSEHVPGEGWLSHHDWWR